MFMNKSKKQTLADMVTRNVLKYMTASGMLFTQKDINNIHIIISKGIQGSALQKQDNTNLFKKKIKKNKFLDNG
jgi:hypothetical protein